MRGKRKQAGDVRFGRMCMRRGKDGTCGERGLAVFIRLLTS